MPTISGPKSLTRNFQRHSGISSSQATSSPSSGGGARGGAPPADDREEAHPEPGHRLDRLVREAALAADGADAVLGAEPLGEAHHARARRRAYANLLVAPRAELAHAGSGVEQERAGEVHRRGGAPGEGPDLPPGPAGAEGGP